MKTKLRNFIQNFIFNLTTKHTRPTFELIKYHESESSVTFKNLGMYVNKIYTHVYSQTSLTRIR